MVITDDEMGPCVPVDDKPASPNRYYRCSKKTASQRPPRTWRTRKDPFGKTWDEIKLRLELIPETGATVLIPWLMTKYPGEYTLKKTRTLQRRIAQWRLDQGSQEEKMREIMTTETPWPAVPIEIAASQPHGMTGQKGC